MNDLQKVFVMLGIILFLMAGVATLLFLFGGALSFGGPTIAVIDFSGEIADSDAAGYISASMLRDMLKDAEEDSGVVAVILKINSGGGGVIESKEMARAVEKFAESKPIVAYIGDVGASGAYYVAAHTDYILSDEDSLLGSIGVISTYTNYQELLEEKLGINTTVIKSGEFKDIGSPYRQMTEEEKARMQEIVDTVYKEFIGVIASRRALTQEMVERVGNGDLFLGSEALTVGLVDATGSFDDAVEKARQLSDSPDAEPSYVDESSYYYTDIYYQMGRGFGDSLASRMQLSDGALKLV